MAEKWVVAIGDPFEGLHLEGPFDDMDQAQIWSEENCSIEAGGDDYHVVTEIEGRVAQKKIDEARVLAGQGSAAQFRFLENDDPELLDEEGS